MEGHRAAIRAVRRRVRFPPSALGPLAWFDARSAEPAHVACSTAPRLNRIGWEQSPRRRLDVCGQRRPFGARGTVHRSALVTSSVKRAGSSKPAGKVPARRTQLVVQREGQGQEADDRTARPTRPGRHGASQRRPARTLASPTLRGGRIRTTKRRTAGVTAGT